MQHVTVTYLFRVLCSAQTTLHPELTGFTQYSHTLFPRGMLKWSKLLLHSQEVPSLQFMWAIGQGQTKGKFYILCSHCTAMQKGQNLEPISKTALFLNPNQTSELIMDSNSSESLCSVVVTNDKEYCEETLMKPLIWSQSKYVPVFRLHSAKIQPVPLKMMMIRVGQIHRKNSHQNCSGHCPIAIRRV